eukprot:731444-Pelagomonas_calceolata.AAC.7
MIHGPLNKSRQPVVFAEDLSARRRRPTQHVCAVLPPFSPASPQFKSNEATIQACQAEAADAQRGCDAPYGEHAALRVMGQLHGSCQEAGGHAEGHALCQPETR